eukprot:403345311
MSEYNSQQSLSAQKKKLQNYSSNQYHSENQNSNHNSSNNNQLNQSPYQSTTNTNTNVTVSVYEQDANEQRRTNQLSLTQRIFSKLLSDQCNKFCFDCGTENPHYVSINQGIFLCFNCAMSIHRLHYGVEISYIKSVFNDPWNHQQLRVLIKSGNKELKEFLEFYDLLYEPIQKRYNTQAMQFYRDRLRATVDGQTYSKEKPSYEQGRKQVQMSTTQQPILYHYLNYRDIMQELFEWETLSLIEQSSPLMQRFDMYIADLEKNNEQIFLQNGQLPPKDQIPLNPNLPPKPHVINEPYCDNNNAISNEDYILLINKLNEFADNTYTFGESIFRKIEEVGNINEKLKVTADKLVNRGSEVGASIFKRTRDSITQINQSSRMSQLKEKASDKLTTLGGKIWGFFGSAAASNEAKLQISNQEQQKAQLTQNSQIKSQSNQSQKRNNDTLQEETKMHNEFEIKKETTPDHYQIQQLDSNILANSSVQKDHQLIKSNTLPNKNHRSANNESMQHSKTMINNGLNDLNYLDSLQKQQHNNDITPNQIQSQQSKFTFINTTASTGDANINQNGNINNNTLDSANSSISREDMGIGITKDMKRLSFRDSMFHSSSRTEEQKQQKKIDDYSIESNIL